MKNNVGQSRGFIHIIIAIVVIVLVLTFFKLDLRGLVESEAGQSNFGYLWELITRLWHWFWGLIGQGSDWLLGFIQSLTN